MWYDWLSQLLFFLSPFFHVFVDNFVRIDNENGRGNAPLSLSMEFNDNLRQIVNNNINWNRRNSHVQLENILFRIPVVLDAVGLRSIFINQFKVIDGKIVKFFKKRSSFLVICKCGWGNWDLEQAAGLAVQVGVELVLALLDVWTFYRTGAFILKCQGLSLRVQDSPYSLGRFRDDSNLNPFIL